MLFGHPASLLRRREALPTSLIAVAFWGLAFATLTNLRYLPLRGLPEFEAMVARATMAFVAVLLGLVAVRSVIAWRKSRSFAPIRRTLGETPGMLLLGAVASYLAIGALALGAEAMREPAALDRMTYQLLHFGVLVAAVTGGWAVLERVGAQRLLQGALFILIPACVVILASPLLRDLGVLSPYRIPFRLTGVFADPNDASLGACMTVALAAAWLTNGGARAIGWLGLIAGVAASLATASRTALVVLGVLAIAFLAINVRGKSRTFVFGWAATVLMGIAGFAVVVLASGGFFEWSRLRSAGVADKTMLFCEPSPTDGLGKDCSVLLATRDVLAGDVVLNWSSDVPVSSWQGVTVDASERRVTRLDLRGMGLNGRIPSDIGGLGRLVSLHLQRNRLGGGIPPELGNLASLEVLNLNHNNLTGAIPRELAKLENLDALRLAANRLTGPVPAALGVLDLSVLRLARNDFDSVPRELAAVATHDLAPARPCLPLPSTSPELFADCTLLLAVKDTLAGDASLNWHAAIPIGFWEGVTVGGIRERVSGLDLHNKMLNGRIPPELGKLEGLVNLNLANNRLTGPIPPELGRLVRLRSLSLDRNSLTGVVPAELGQLGRLDSMWLRENRLTGPVSPALSDVRDHDLRHLVFCAPPAPLDPELFEDCTSLLEAKETLAGAAELNWSVALPLLEWEGVNVGRHGRLTELRLAAKGLTGRIPRELGSLDDLVVLDLSANQLTGSVPPELEQLVGLRGLSLDRNALNGPVPSKLLEIPRTAFGDLLVCEPPPGLSPALFDDCVALRRMARTLAGSVRLNWSAALPMEEWRGVTVGGPEGRITALELPRMGLNGRIPAALGQLTGLRTIVLDGNDLTGPIPPELGKLTHLEVLGLGSNALTGAVPSELANLSSLRELWLSGNDLTGPLPPELRAVARREPSCPSVQNANPGLRGDCETLLAVKHILAGDAALNWSEHVPMESWQGVTIGGTVARVTMLKLPRSGLNGRIPPALGRLSHLVSLDLGDNGLAGPVPPELGELTNLEHLTLSSNALKGPVPAELEDLEKLNLLRLSGNKLERPFPARLFRIASNDIVVEDMLPRRPMGDAHAAQTLDRPVNAARSAFVERLFCRPSSGIVSDLQADCALLLSSREVLAGDAPLNWSEDIPLEFWQGVTVRGAPKRVTALELPRAGLNGRLAAQLGELRGLVSLNLGHNRLGGPIPPGLGGMERLVSLRLEGNQFTGPVPPELARLGNLSFLRLAGNDLHRPFPAALHDIVDHDLDTPAFCRPRKIDPGLQADCALLLAVRDSLAGAAPLNWHVDVPVDDWQGVTMDRSRGRVTALDLTQMGLNGHMPAELGGLAGLVSLRLGRNRLVGEIPPELGDLVDLRMLALDGNLLTGPVPPELGKLSKLTDLGLRWNRLGGSAPPSVVALPKLVGLRQGEDAAGQDRRRGSVLDRNLLCQRHLKARSHLHGDCTTLLDARHVLGGDVQLNWHDEVPISYWRGVTVGLPDLAGDAAAGLRVIALDLSHMGLNGRIPAELSALDALAVLRLGDNRLAGSIPPALGALAGLRTLALENNALAGAMPQELGALHALVSLRLGGNELTGRPEQFNTLTGLRVLAAEGNNLTGNLHPGLGHLRQLEELRLENNRLHGSIPAQLDWLANLAVLRLGGNALAGCVRVGSRAAQVRDNDLDSAGLLCESPPSIKPGLFEDGARLMRMRDILAGDALLNWSYVRPVSSWRGVSIGKEGRVVGLNLRDMDLTGRIPRELGELRHLSVLRLDGNQLTGPIPPELANLTRLKMLSLDGNRLTGPIPPRPAGFEGLSVDVTGNGVRGQSPQELLRLPTPDFDGGLDRTALAMDRPLLWRLGFEKAIEAPFFGHGLWALEYMDGAPIGHHGRPLGVHNLYLSLLGEAGIVPLLLFVSTIVLLLRRQWAAPKSLARDATVAGVFVIALYCMSLHHLLGMGAFMFLAGLSVAIGTAPDARHVPVSRQAQPRS